MGSAAHPITRCDAILVHMNRFALREFSEYSMPYGLTQDGIAVAVGITRAHVSLELKKLREKDLVEMKLAHVTERGAKRNVYYLKPSGLTEAHRVEERIKRMDIDIESLFVDRSIRDISPRDPDLSAALNDIKAAGEILRNISEENAKYNRHYALTHVTNAIKHLALSMEVFP